MYSENARSRGLLLGLPAVILMLMSVSAFAWTQIGRQKNLEARYDLLAEKAEQEQQKIAEAIREEQLSAPASSSNDKPLKANPRCITPAL